MEIHSFKTFLERYSKQKIDQWGHLSPFRISISKPVKPLLQIWKTYQTGFESWSPPKLGLGVVEIK